MRSDVPRRSLLLTALAGTGAAVLPKPAFAAAPARDRLVRALTRAADGLSSTEPSDDLADLRPFGRLVGDAPVVGVGEASHGAHEFFTLKHRLMRYLMREKGFTTFALEASWSTGLRLNAYVLHGTGDPGQIMHEDFQSNYRIWNTREYLDLIEWMRDHNRRHGTRLQFMGDDICYPGPELFDAVTDHVRRHHPRSLARFTDLYDGLAPTIGAGAWIDSYRLGPRGERLDAAARAQDAVDELERLGSGPDPQEAAWAVQHARVIAAALRMWSADFTDPVKAAEAFGYREQVMADNVLWWQRRTGHRMLVSGANGHIARRSFWAGYSKVQGTFLTERLGDGYVSVGLTFDQGAFLARADNDAPLAQVCVGPAVEGSNEHTLDQVPLTDFLLNPRTAPEPARSWLAQARPTRSIGEFYPEPDQNVALSDSYDAIIHVSRISAAQPRS